MATPISRDILNREVDTRFWLQSRYKIGKPLDPKNPLDKAKIPVWNDIFRKVKAEADAGTLVVTYDKPEVVQALSDAAVASTVAEAHVDAAAKEPDPTTAQMHAAAAATAAQVAAMKAREGAASQPPTVSPQLEHEAAHEAAKMPPPPQAPAADHIAHAQLQNGLQNGARQNGARLNEGMLRPEDDPWDPRYVPKTPIAPSPEPTRPARPSKSPRERVSRDTLNKETNTRFWIREKYKPHQKLDLAIPEDREMAEIWKEIFQEVQREANEGRLTLTDPALIPPPSAPLPPAPLRPEVPAPTPQPQQSTPPLPPDLIPSWMQQWLQPGTPTPTPTPMPPLTPTPTPMPPSMPTPTMPVQRPAPMPMPMPTMPVQRPMPPSIPVQRPPAPREDVPTPFPTRPAPAPTPTTPMEAEPIPSRPPRETPPAPGPATPIALVEEPFFTGKTVALGVLGLAALLGISYVATRRQAPPRSYASVAGASPGRASKAAYGPPSNQRRASTYPFSSSYSPYSPPRRGRL